MAYKAIAFAHALRHRLRGTDPEQDLRPLLDGDELHAAAAAANPPAAVLAGLNEDLRECLARG
jgi:putative membrane protein